MKERAKVSRASTSWLEAAREVPELAQKFVFKPGTTTYLAFRTAARGMAAEAQNHKDMLVKYGMADTVLENLLLNLDQFDAAVENGASHPSCHPRRGSLPPHLPFAASSGCLHLSPGNLL